MPAFLSRSSLTLHLPLPYSGVAFFWSVGRSLSAVISQYANHENTEHQ